VVDQKARRGHVLEVRAMYEPCRIARQELIRAYERLAPSRRRKINSRPEGIQQVDEAEQKRSQGGGR